MFRASADADDLESSHPPEPTPPPHYVVPRPTSLPAEQWPEIIARAECEGIRPIAHDLGVSHETIRALLRAAGRADLLEGADRHQRLAAAAPPPPPPPRKIPLEHHPEVRQLCERHTQAEVAALFGVSQMTIWRIVHGRRH